MKIRHLGLMAALAAGLASPAGAQEDRRGWDDLMRRIAALEARVAELERDRAQGPAPSRGVDVPVNQYCTWESCSQMASRICKEGGFERGVPAVKDPDDKLRTITCFD